MKLPALRPDVEYFQTQVDGKPVLAFYDMQRFVPEYFAMDAEALQLMPFFDGTTDLSKIEGLNDGVLDGMRALQTLLEEYHVLDTVVFRKWKSAQEAAFELDTVRKPVCAGTVYPAEAAACRAFLDAAFSGVEAAPMKAKAIFAPHIDYRVGLNAYLQAFKTLAAARPERVVLIGTAHYAGLHGAFYDEKRIIATEKHFETPLGLAKTDRDSVRALLEACPQAVTGLDRAHRIEHSLELHMLLLQYLLGDAVEIVPLLVSGLDEMLYMSASPLETAFDGAAAWLGARFAADEKTVFCISGDLAHVGRKFGDRKSASALLPEVQEFDRRFLSAAASGSAPAVVREMRSNEDRYRICGFPPLLLALKALQGLRGEALAYQTWDETERQSAVTFGSVVFTE